MFYAKCSIINIFMEQILHSKRIINDSVIDNYLTGVCTILMFRSVRCIAKGFTAARMFTRVGFFAGMRSKMSF